MPKQRDWWCRLYSEVVDDDKLTWVADTTGERRVVILGVWTGILALANRSPERGTLLVADHTPYMVQLLARKLDVDVPALESILNAMCAIGLLEGEPLRVAAWERRNPVSDDAAVRQQQRRARVTSSPVVTPLSRDNVVTGHDDVTPASISGSGSISVSELEGVGGVGEGGDDRMQAFEAYQAEIGLVTPAIDQDIVDLLDGGIPPAWVKEACEEAGRQNKRSWSYARAIVERWRVEGRGNGPGPPGKSPPRALTPEQVAAFERKVEEAQRVGP